MSNSRNILYKHKGIFVFILPYTGVLAIGAGGLAEDKTIKLYCHTCTLHLVIANLHVQRASVQNNRSERATLHYLMVEYQWLFNTTDYL